MATYTDSAYETFSVSDALAMAIQTFDCWEQLAVWTDFTDRVGSLLAESAVVQDSATLVAGGTATEVANIRSSLHPEFHLVPGLANETAEIKSSVVLGWTQAVTETATLDDAVQQAIYTLAREEATLDDSVQSRTRSIQVVTDSFSIYSDLPSNNGALAVETFVVTSSAQHGVRTTTVVTEQLQVNDNIVTLATARDTAESELLVNDAVVHNLHGANLAVEQFYIGDTLIDPRRTAWAADIRQLGMSRYDGLQSKQMAVIKGVTVGVSDTGLFKFTGSKPVKAAITTGKRDFSSDQKKRIEGVFAYGESDSRLQLTVKCDKRGEEVEYDYEFMNRLTENTRNTRAKVGKGLASRYYQFTISNPDGADFALRRLFADVGVSTRRI